MPQRPSAWSPLAAASVLLVLASSCSKEEMKPDLTPRLGVLELPSSHRTGDPEPSGAARIEITPTELLVDGEQALPLENGKVPAAERSGYDLPKLKAKLSGKRALALSVYAAVPYATLARTIHTGLGAGASEISFKVRKPNSTSQTGWLTLRQNHFIESPEDSKFTESDLVSWDNFVNVWDESLEACQASTARGLRLQAAGQGDRWQARPHVARAGLGLGVALPSGRCGPCCGRRRGHGRR